MNYKESAAIVFTFFAVLAVIFFALGDATRIETPPTKVEEKSEVFVWKDKLIQPLPQVVVQEVPTEPEKSYEALAIEYDAEIMELKHILSKLTHEEIVALELQSTEQEVISHIAMKKLTDHDKEMLGIIE